MAVRTSPFPTLVAAPHPTSTEKERGARAAERGLSPPLLSARSQPQQAPAPHCLPHHIPRDGVGKGLALPGLPLAAHTWYVVFSRA